MRHFIHIPVIALAGLLLCGPARADEISDWNHVALQAIRTEPLSPPRASRALAMVHLAMYDAVNAINPTHQPYHMNLTPAPNTSARAAAAQAARDVLMALMPSQQAAFDTALTNSLNAIPAGEARDNGVAFGTACANDMLALRANDNSGLNVPYTPAPPGTPGRWQPTPPGNLPALLPNWPQVTPFGMTSGSQFRAVGPPALTSAQYRDAYNEVREIGALNSATRTADQTNIARFWADGGGTSTPPGHWNRIAQTVGAAQGNSLNENARMFALLNMAMADAGISCWDTKYHTDFWRPITGIRQGDNDTNDDTVGDPTWAPLITTPNFPSYTSGHSTFSGAAARALALFFGTDDVAFTSSAEGFAVPDRSFTSFSHAANEAMLSRLYGGIHWSFDNEDGLTAGLQIGDWTVDNYLQPIPEPASFVLLALGGLMAVRRRS